MTGIEVEKAFICNVWCEAILNINTDINGFSSQFGGWAQDIDIEAREKVLDLLDMAQSVLAKRYDQALNEYVETRNLHKAQLSAEGVSDERLSHSRR